MSIAKKQRNNSIANEEISPYLLDLAAIPQLSESAEQELTQALAAASTREEASRVRTRLIEGNLLLVVHLASCYHQAGLSLADLVQEGNLALVKAAQLFDRERHSCFRQFAGRFICWTLCQIVEEQCRYLTETSREHF